MPTSVRLPEEIEKRLDALAAATGRSKAFYIKEAIVEHLEDLEDGFIALKRLEDLKAGKGETVALEDVMKRYGLGS